MILTQNVPSPRSTCIKRRISENITHASLCFELPPAAGDWSNFKLLLFLVVVSVPTLWYEKISVDMNTRLHTPVHDIIFDLYILDLDLMDLDFLDLDFPDLDFPDLDLISDQVLPSSSSFKCQ